MRDQKPTYRIMDLEVSERPRERLARLGPQALNNAELIGILLRVGVEGENAVQMGQRLLNNFGGIRGLHRATFNEVVRERQKRRLSKRPSSLAGGFRWKRLKNVPPLAVPETPLRWCSLKCRRWKKNICG